MATATVHVSKLWGKGSNQALRLPDMQTTDGYNRIVKPTEDLHEVMHEAIQHGCYVWTNRRNRTVISKVCPLGYYKVPATYRLPTDFPPNEAA
jgi:hypothetical protein